jgi:hypothetical protein
MDYGGFTLMIETDGKNWYWAAYLPSGKVSHYSPMYSTIEGVCDSAKAHIYNINAPHVTCLRFDQRIKPRLSNEDLSNYEEYFRKLLKMYESVQETTHFDGTLVNTGEVPLEVVPSSETEPTPPRKGHLTLVQ